MADYPEVVERLRALVDQSLKREGGYAGILHASEVQEALDGLLTQVYAVGTLANRGGCAMSEQITSAAELDAPHYLRMVKCTERSCGTRVRYGELTDDANTHWHIRPGVALVTIPDQPRRVQPSREDVADTLIQARSSGMCHFGKVCNLCDCGLEGHTDDEARRADARTLIEADAVLGLFAQQPYHTVTEIGAAE